MKKLISTLSAAILFAGAVKAQKPAVVVSDKTGWHKITETVVSFDKETDKVDVMLADKFAALKFKVTDAPIELQDVDIYFEDKTMQNVVIGNHLKAAGESSREIDLKGASEKTIDKIVLKYKTVKNTEHKKGHVEIWGKKTNTDKMNDHKDNKGKGAEKSDEHSMHNK
jgi:hypothetical protein